MGLLIVLPEWAKQVRDWQVSPHVNEIQGSVKVQ